MSTCDKCKFWGVYMGGSCDRVGDLHTSRTPESAFDIEANASDDSGLTAFLMTGPKFGCVQFALKELEE